MNCLLVSISGCPRTPSDFIPDNGLALLAGVLVAAGHRARILDYNTTETLARLFPARRRAGLTPLARALFEEGRRPGAGTFLRLALVEKSLAAYRERVFNAIAGEIACLAGRDGFDFVGFKLWHGDGFTASLKAAAALKKARPDRPVFGGGPQVDIFREEILRATPHFDALVYGEGEAAILGLAECVRGRRSFAAVPNLIYRENGRVAVTPPERVSDLDALPPARYEPDIYPAMAGDRRLRYLVLDDSRGCAHACHFCMHPQKSGRQVRTRQPRRLVEEMVRARDRYGVTLFRFGGSNTPPALLEAVSREILSRRLRVRYTALTDLRRPGTDFDLLRRAGCFALFFGVESTDRRILSEKMNKQADPETMAAILAAARTAGIFTVASLIVPAPGETPASQADTLSFLAAARPSSVLVQFPGLIPGTEWAARPGKYGFTLREPAAYPRRMLHYPMKMFFPPRFWTPLPYRVDGKPFRRFAAESEAFAARLERELGLTTMVADDVALMADVAGLAPAVLRDRSRGWFFSGDAVSLQAFIGQVNRGSAAVAAGAGRPGEHGPGRSGR